MPDWFYRTVARTSLFCLPDKAGRAVALTVIGTLGKTAPGRAMIDFMGHMDADPRLAVRVAGTDFRSPIGLGWRVDPEQRATRGLSRFGVGCIEVLKDRRSNVSRSAGEQLIDGASTSDPARSERNFGCPLLLRKISAAHVESVELPSGAALPVLSWDEEPPVGLTDVAAGVVLQVGSKDVGGGWRVPTVMPADLPDRVRAWRQRLPAGAAIVVAGGISGPEDALALIDAGADLILIDAGLVFRGPGLVKRCNDALLRRRSAAGLPPVVKNPFRQSWVWAFGLGAGMMVGGLATLALALTKVLLPYDEHYLGLTGSVLQRNSPRLFAFMAHDRGTLAGVMLGLGWLYLMLARHGVRRNVHGARTALVASALAGFASFFAFFGFGYFDTLHAFVAAVLFQLTVQVMVGSQGGAPDWESEVECEDATWRRAQWGQLFWIVHAAGLLIAGAVILGIGMTSVFVNEDLNFLCLSAAQAGALGVRMIGVVAHDRATLGGMLISSGVAMLLSVLWCFRRGAEWLWRAIAGLGALAYCAALGVHFWVGYTDWRHMVPALAGCGLWLGGLFLGRAYLRSTSAESES
jgi:hypothetical protein